MGASMQGPDFVQWHGFFEVAENFYTKFLPQAKEAATATTKVLAVIKAVEDDRPPRLEEGSLARRAPEDRRVLQGTLRQGLSREALAKGELAGESAFFATWL